jgi:hypothetical protein
VPTPYFRPFIVHWLYFRPYMRLKIELPQIVKF